MRLNEVWPEDDLVDLSEAGLRDKIGKMAMAGAIGAGLLGGGYQAYQSSTKPSNVIQSPKITPAAPDVQPNQQSSPADREIDKSATIPSPGIPENPPKQNRVVMGGQPHHVFPTVLHTQRSVSRQDRISNFNEILRPIIREVNAEILIDRDLLKRLQRLDHQISQKEIQFIESLRERYRVNLQDQKGTNKTIAQIINELLMHVDIIPEDLAIAQAALETGWGSSDLARQSNNFFGQKATHRNPADEKILNTDGLHYRYYDDPKKSIQSYAHNLNSHPGYREFRQTRARLRRQASTSQISMAKELSKHLRAYSTNPQYSAELQTVMNMSRGFSN